VLAIPLAPAAIAINRFAWSNRSNTIACAAQIFFFALSVVGYLVHGWLRDADINSLMHIASVVSRFPKWECSSSFLVLLVSEIRGFVVIASGFRRTSLPRIERMAWRKRA
jgi:hypothetical protein